MDLVLIIAIAVLVIGILVAVFIFVKFNTSTNIIEYPTSNTTIPVSQSTFSQSAILPSENSSQNAATSSTQSNWSGSTMPVTQSTSKEASLSISDNPKPVTAQSTSPQKEWGIPSSLSGTTLPQKKVSVPLQEPEKKEVSQKAPSADDVSLKDFLKNKYVPLLEQQLQEKVSVLDITPDGANMIFRAEIAGEKISLLVDADGKIIDFKRIAA